MERAYRALLKLYPYDFRAAFGAELASLVTGAAAEWIAKLTSDSFVRARSLPDRRMMRPAGMPRELWFGRTECSSDTSR